MFKYLLNILLLTLALQTCTAGDILLKSRFYSQKNGLSSYNISCIAEDKYGFIWIGTQDGLNFFDGIQFKVFNKTTEHPIGGNDIKSIVYDKKNNLLWVAFSYGGISAIDCKTHKVIKNLTGYKALLPLKDPNIRTIFLTLENKLLIITEKECFLYNTSNSSFENIFNEKSFHFDSYDIAAAGDDNDNYYFFLNNTGIVCISKKNHSTLKIIKGFKNVPLSLAANFSKTIIRTADKVLFAVDSGIGYIDKDLNCRLICKTKGLINEFTLDKQNNLWFCKESEIVLINGVDPSNSSKVSFTDNLNASAAHFLCAFVDSKNNIWIGGSEGLVFSDMTLPVFISYSTDPITKKKLNHLYDMLPINSLVYLNDLKGLKVIDTRTGKIKDIDSSSYPFYVWKMPDDDIIFNNEAGFFLIQNDRASQSLLLKKYPEFTKINNRFIGGHSILNDSIIIFSGEDFKGLIIWDHKNHLMREIFPGKKDGWLDNAINMLYRQDDENIIICQDKCISFYNTRNGSIINRFLPINNNQDTVRLYFDIVNLNSKYIIAAYGYGIFITDHSLNVLKTINTTNGLSNNGVYRILNDNHGNVWVSTNYGLNRINLTDYSVSSYFENDGLNTNSFEEMSAASYNGDLYFGGLFGFTIVKPQNFQKNNSRPDVYFMDYTFKSSEKDTTITNIEQFEVEILPDVLQSTFHYAAINYAAPEKTNYYYQIKEIQKKWIKSDGPNFISIMGLNPGTYHLLLKGVNENGIESEIKELTLIFLPKWYQTWWFKLLLVLAAIGAVYGLYRIRINQLRKEQQIKTRLASDLHDDLGSTMNSVKVYANLALMEKEQEKYLLKIKEGTQEAITGIKDMIWVLDDSKGSIEDLLARVSLFASSLCEANNIQYKREISDEARNHKLGQEERRNLYMMMKEAINNAIKYSEAQQIVIAIVVKKGKPEIAIKDDGKGFDITKTTEGNGLKNMNRRAKEIKYHINIKSAPGKGTSISFQKI
jgi:ligand-binding sensor domain-containing protein/two-component sensor histidine kinase